MPEEVNLGWLAQFWHAEHALSQESAGVCDFIQSFAKQFAFSAPTTYQGHQHSCLRMALW